MSFIKKIFLLIVSLYLRLHFKSIIDKGDNKTIISDRPITLDKPISHFGTIPNIEPFKTYLTHLEKQFKRDI